ncbi:hypothetical protein MLD38_030290 [Melastoma candidum]|uniref:Uncharacterized protein n=1 Tax=Melastoma candidum TaxID=119954 RepID=A0ACB9MKS8_9MYRT|nr:hypothetical protein MLD38_030290 [Melastoma candidum]
MPKYRDDPRLIFRVDDDGGIADNSGEEEEEEALSLSGLALELGQTDRPCLDGGGNPLEEGSESGSESEFEFGLGSVEMRAADDLFFQGMILPLLRDGSGAPSSGNESLGETPGLSTVEPVSRSDSLESGSIGRVLSTSSRSSSKGSQHSSSGSTSSTSTSSGSSPVVYHSLSTSYLFGSCQSPSPQTGFPGSNKTALLQGNKIRSKSHRSSAMSLSSSSMMWEFFRPGLVRTPDIELHDLKIRTSNNRNGNNSNNICDDYDPESRGKKDKKKGMRGFGLLRGCKCTADSVATNLVLLRSDSSRIRSRRKSNVGSGEEEKELRRKLMELIEVDDSRMKKPKAKKEATAGENNRRVPSSSSRQRRTFEWLKELPRAAAAGGGGYYVLHQHY